VPKEKETWGMLGFLESLASLVAREGHPVRVLLSCTYALKSSEWKTVVPLPFSPPGLLDNMPGAQIAGIDFSFEKPTAEFPLARAFVSTYPDAKTPDLRTITVKFMVLHRTALDAALWSKAIESAEGTLPLFAKPTEKVAGA